MQSTSPVESTIHTPLLVLIRGLPGSGKSYLAQALGRQLGDNIVMLDPDATDYSSPSYQAHSAELTEQGVDAALHPYRFLRAQAYRGIEQGQVIIWNQPFTNLEIFHKMLDGLKNYAAEHHTDLNVLVVEVQADPAIAKDRVNERKAAGGHGPSDATFQRFTSDYVSFADQGYPTVTVYGHDDIARSVEAVRAGMDQFSY
jgi:predicted kinase